MPTAKEVISNRGLSGSELKQIIREDAVERLLEAEGMLSDHLAYGRIGYDLTLRLYFDNPSLQQSTTFVESRRASVQQVAADPSLAALETPPPSSLSQDASVGATRLTRRIDSPNAERIRAGLPIRVEVKQPDRTISVEEVHYPPDPTVGEGDVTIEDATSESRAAWGLPPGPSSSLSSTPDPALAEIGKCGCTRAAVALSGLCGPHGIPWIPATSPDPVTAVDGSWPLTQDDKVSKFFGGVADAAKSVVRAVIGAEDPT